MALIRLGYACLNTQLPSSNRACRLSRADPGRLLDLSRQNLAALEAVLRWNAAHGVGLFRISSGVIPFASHPVNTLPWWDLLQPELARLGEVIRASGQRVSMHPGQYTVLNSPRPEVVENSLAELEYHARFLDALGVGPENKIVLHLGGVYGDKPAALRRLAENAARLSLAAATRLALENDERSYTLEDALGIAATLGVPVVFDVFHHAWNPSYLGEPLRALVELASASWTGGDGPPKLHYSNQWSGKPPGSHSQSVDVSDFGRFYDQVGSLRLDVMLEVKDKEQSVLELFRVYPDLALQFSNLSPH